MHAYPNGFNHYMVVKNSSCSRQISKSFDIQYLIFHVSDSSLPTVRSRRDQIYYVFFIDKFFLYYREKDEPYRRPYPGKHSPCC